MLWIRTSFFFVKELVQVVVRWYLPAAPAAVVLAEGAEAHLARGGAVGQCWCRGTDDDGGHGPGRGGEHHTTAGAAGEGLVSRRLRLVFAVDELV